MVNIAVGNGQGITQAIASNLGLNGDDCKKVKLSTWTQVMSLVNQNNQQNISNNKESIFTGGNDVNKINDKASWKTDFKVAPNQQMQFDESIWSKIKELLTGKPQETKPAETTAAAASQQTAEVQETTQQSAQSVQQAAPSQETAAAELVKKGETLDKTFKSMSNPESPTLINADVEVQITDDNWRALAGKKDKTDAEKQQLDTQYKTNIKNLGNAYTVYIDKTFGNGDGVISEEEYTAFEQADMPEELKGDAEAAQLPKNAFKHLDLDKSGTIDNEEIAAYLHALDFGTEDGKSNGLNGKISAYDFMANSIALGKPEKGQMLDKKMAYTYNALFGKKPVE